MIEVIFNYRTQQKRTGTYAYDEKSLIDFSPTIGSEESPDPPFKH